MSFVPKIKVAYNNLKILVNKGSLLNNEKRVELNFLEQNLIFMIPYIQIIATLSIGCLKSLQLVV